jgi:N-sulfoglucosamine sulfohydrolase
MKKEKLMVSLLLGGMLAHPSACLAQDDRLNVLLFTADDLDRNSLGCYGSGVPDISPNIDHFASEGCIYSKAYVNAAISAPSRAIIATGLYGHNSSVMGFMKMKEDNTAPLLMEILKENGFMVGVLSKVSHSTPKADFKWDYTIESEDLGYGRSPSRYYRYTKTFFDECKASGKPFYLMVNSEDPHRPYQTPDGVFRKNAEAPSRYYSPDEAEVPDFIPDLPLVRKELSYYYNSVKRLDDTFGMVMKALEESGLKEKTLVIFISDNGIAIPFAKCNVYYASNRTPWIVRWPGVISPGSRDDRNYISEVELTPTILDAVKIETPARFDGRSQLRLYTRGAGSGNKMVYTQIDNKISGGPVPMRSVQNTDFVYIYNPWSDGERIYTNNNEGLTMKAMEEAARTDTIIAARVKLFRVRVPEEYYDLTSDPGCTVNLISDPAYTGDIAKARKAMLRFMKQSDDPVRELFVNRNKSPEIRQRLLYEVFPQAAKYDEIKSHYSRKMDDGSNYKD